MISIVMVVYDMAREAVRTLQSLAPTYQEGVHSDDYEVVVVDNGSPVPMDHATVRGFGANFSLLRIDQASPSPVAAMNWGVAMSRGQIVGLLLDGARLVTPGLLKYASLAFSMHRDPTVFTLGWHLGPAAQQQSVLDGYDGHVEAELLARIGWPTDGYRLFEIASLAPSSGGGYFRPISESNALFLRRSTYDALGGYDEAFDLPGGGLANLDFFKRACERYEADVVCLMGEGNFHQVHGGISTNRVGVALEQRQAEWWAQYERIRGRPWDTPVYTPEYLGTVPSSLIETIAISALKATESGNCR